MSETGHTHASDQFPTVCNEENEKLSERSFCTTQTLKIKRFLMTFFLAIHDTFKDDVSLHQLSKLFHSEKHFLQESGRDTLTHTKKKRSLSLI